MSGGEGDNYERLDLPVSFMEWILLGGGDKLAGNRVRWGDGEEMWDIRRVYHLSLARGW